MRGKKYSAPKKLFFSLPNMRNDDEECVMLNYLLSSSRIVFAIRRFSHTWFACWAIKPKKIISEIS